MTYEQDRAQMKAERNVASDDYFDARPQLDFPDFRWVFKAGFQLGWNERNEKVIELQARIDSLQEQLEQLAD